MCTSLASIVLAASFVAPTMPESTHDDTEVVTNFALPAICADSRVFAFALELDVTPSNNVEVAFGHDADGDGMLSRSEATMVAALTSRAVAVVCGEDAEMADRYESRNDALRSIARTGN